MQTTDFALWSQNLGCYSALMFRSLCSPHNNFKAQPVLGGPIILLLYLMVIKYSGRNSRMLFMLTTGIPRFETREDYS